MSVVCLPAFFELRAAGQILMKSSMSVMLLGDIVSMPYSKWYYILLWVLCDLDGRVFCERSPAKCQKVNSEFEPARGAKH